MLRLKAKTLAMAGMANSPIHTNGYQGQGPQVMNAPGPQMMNSPPRGANVINPKSHVGFDSITSQIERKLLKRGFQFNVICVGMFSLVTLNGGTADNLQDKPVSVNPHSSTQSSHLSSCNQKDVQRQMRPFGALPRSQTHPMSLRLSLIHI